MDFDGHPMGIVGSSRAWVGISWAWVGEPEDIRGQPMGRPRMGVNVYDELFRSLLNMQRPRRRAE